METGMLHQPAAWMALAIFVIAYVFVILEEKTELKKSKPVLVGAGLIWMLVAWVSNSLGIDPEKLHNAADITIQDYGSLLLFILVAMTYICALEDRNVFDALRSKLVYAGLSYRQLFWCTGFLAFFISPIADNMTTALVVGAIVLALTAKRAELVPLMFVNIVNASNAGGSFSPFGDITTLMVWQAGKIQFFDFAVLFLPSLACFIVPAAIMSFAVPKDKPEAMQAKIIIKKGGKAIIGLGFLTIALAVLFEQLLHLPSFMGMMLGLGLLMLVSYRLRSADAGNQFDIYHLMKDIEWDTLMFFFGIIFCISGLGYLGYLDIASHGLFGSLGADKANIIIGASSALIDNIPLMFATLSMHPDMNEFEWLLLTLTLGTGGSLLSIGSAAGVALMGVGKGKYTFMNHLRWTPALLLGYGLAIWIHYLVNT